jgi:hypothetical protein
MSTDDDPGTAARLDALEHWRAGFARPRYRDVRDGRAVLSVRIGDELAALVRRTAHQRGCTIADLLRPAIRAAVNQPSTEPLSEFPPTFTPHKLPREATRQAITRSLTEQAGLAAADAARTAGRLPRDGRMTEPGIMTELPGSGLRRPR